MKEPFNIDELQAVSKDELISRLVEAESALEAIRSGEIDAFIVPGINEDQIYTLKNADHPYRLLIEDMNEGAVTLSDSIIIYSNQCFAKILHHPLERIIGSSIYDYLQSDELPKFKELLNKASHDNIVRSEFHLKRENSFVQVQIAVNPINFDGFSGHCLIITDVTQLKLKEEALEKWAKLFENAQWGIAVCRANDFELEMMNPAFLKMYEYEMEDLIGKTVSSLFCKKESPIDIEKNMNMAKERGKYIFESVHCRKDGTSFPVEIDLTAVKDSLSHETFYYVVNIRDLTNVKRTEDLTNEIKERKKREEILSESQAQLKTLSEALERSNEELRLFASIIESSEDAIISKNLQGIIASWNKGAERIFGYKADEVIGKSINILIPEGRDGEELEILRRIMRGERIDHYDTIRQRKDGTLINISLTISPVKNSSGVIIGASKIARDVTERKRAEEALKTLAAELEERVVERTYLLEEQAERLRQLAVELTEVEQQERRRLAEVLHDHLQQYLVAAKMRLDLVERKSENIDRAGLKEARSYIDQAATASRQLTAELRPPVLYEGGLSAGLRYLVQKIKDQHQLRVSLSVSGNIEPGSDLVKVMIYQCVQELLFNAVKYAGVSECSVSVSRVENNIQVKVEDHGLGFDVSNLGKINKGGFGLFSIRERVKALGGEFHVSSMIDKGSVFTLMVPDKMEGSVLPGNGGVFEEKIFNPGRTYKEGIIVLVADDHLIIRQSIASLLKSQLFIKDVIEAANGEEAIRKAEEVDPDIILMDVNMPVMNGIEATEILTRRKFRSKVIGLSVQAESEMSQTMKDAGAVAYFNKGDDTHALIEAIKRFAFPHFAAN